MKKLTLKHLLRLNAIAWVCLAAAGLSACQPHPAKTEKDSAEDLKEAGYAHSPVVTGVEEGHPGSLIVSGNALPDGRVRFLYGQQRAIGVTADSKGHFRAELPANPQGSVFDLLSIEDSGRLIHAEGRLFVPPGQPAKSVVMRPGSPSLPVYGESSAVAVMDYDGAGALAVAGKVSPRTPVNLIVNGEIRAQTPSDSRGFFSAMTQIPPPGDAEALVSVTVEAGKITLKRDVTVTKPVPGDGDRVTPIPEGWRVDWRVPGGGIQTTLVF